MTPRPLASRPSPTRRAARALALGTLAALALPGALTGCAASPKPAVPGLTRGELEAGAEPPHEHAPRAPEGRKLLTAGEPAPSFALADETGRVRTLAELHANGPVVVVFFYGSWCKSCRDDLLELQRLALETYPESPPLVAISVEKPEKAARMVQQLGLRFPVLADPDLSVAQAFGVADAVNRLALGAIFVVDQAGVVRWSQLGEDSLTSSHTMDALRDAR